MKHEKVREPLSSRGEGGEAKGNSGTATKKNTLFCSFSSALFFIVGAKTYIDDQSVSDPINHAEDNDIIFILYNKMKSFTLCAVGAATQLWSNERMMVNFKLMMVKCSLMMVKC